MVVVLMLQISQEAFANDINSKNVDYVGTQEIDVSLGLPYTQLFRSASIFGDALGGFNFISPSDITTGDNRVILPTFKAEYGYNILNWLNLGTGLTYSYGSYMMIYKEDNSHAWDVTNSAISIFFNIKFYWLNRKMVRMYSGIGVGVGVVTSNSGAENIEEATRYTTNLLPTIDIRLVGLTVGHKLYGRFEIGTLSSGLITAGIGYRF